jgi:hypothetical protein
MFDRYTDAGTGAATPIHRRVPPMAQHGCDMGRFRAKHTPDPGGSTRIITDY